MGGGNSKYERRGYGVSWPNVKRNYLDSIPHHRPSAEEVFFFHREWIVEAQSIIDVRFRSRQRRYPQSSCPCYCCGRGMPFMMIHTGREIPDPFNPRMEKGHVIARVKGGPYILNNLFPICFDCNRLMRTRLPSDEEFLEDLARRRVVKETSIAYWHNVRSIDDLHYDGMDGYQEFITFLKSLKKKDESSSSSSSSNDFLPFFN